MNSVEETYNEVPYHLKDSAGLPFVFYKLTQDSTSLLGFLGQNTALKHLL